MKVKLEKIVNGKAALSKLLNEPLPIKASYRLSKIIRKVESELKDFEAKRFELIKKYGAEDQEKQTWTVIPENVETFTKEINDLLSLEISLELDALHVEELGNASISATELLQLEGFILPFHHFIIREG